MTTNMKEELLSLFKSFRQFREQVVAADIVFIDVENDYINGDTYEVVNEFKLKLDYNNNDMYAFLKWLDTNYQPYANVLSGIIYLTDNRWIERFSDGYVDWWEVCKTPTIPDYLK